MEDCRISVEALKPHSTSTNQVRICLMVFSCPVLWVFANVQLVLVRVGVNRLGSEAQGGGGLAADWSKQS